MLADAGRNTKVHLYYCMKNCDQSPTKLRENILNIVSHYQVSLNMAAVLLLHVRECVHVLRCRTSTQIATKNPTVESGHSSSKIPLTSPAAIEAYRKILQSTLIYKDAESYR